MARAWSIHRDVSNLLTGIRRNYYVVSSMTNEKVMNVRWTLPSVLFFNPLWLTSSCVTRELRTVCDDKMLAHPENIPFSSVEQIILLWFVYLECLMGVTNYFSSFTKITKALMILQNNVKWLRQNDTLTMTMNILC